MAVFPAACLAVHQKTSGHRDLAGFPGVPAPREAFTKKAQARLDAPQGCINNSTERCVK